MKNIIGISWLSILGLSFTLKSSLGEAKPKLLVTIVVDQMRADYLDRDREYFLAPNNVPNNGGFRWLEAKGARFTHAKHLTFLAVTCSGHASILTGTTPSRHGIYKNNWWDPTQQKEVYCVEDNLSKNINGTEQAASPRALQAPTLGDEIKSTLKSSRVFSVALKDRASVMLGGKNADIALWFDHKSMQWTSSDWYLPKGELPSWVGEENRWVDKQKGDIFKWQAEIKSDQRFTALGFLPTFPYSLPKKDQSSLASPYGVELTTRMAKRLFTENKLGQGPGFDLLNVSYSSTDYVGHQFGPNHQATLEIYKAADRGIADLIKTILQKIPIKDVIFVLTADHGVTPVPEESVAGRQLGTRVKAKELENEIEEMLSAKFGKLASGKWLAAASEFQFYFGGSVIGEQREQASQILKTFLQKKDWVATAFTKSDVESNKLMDPLIRRQVLATIPMKVLPDVGVVIKPYTTNEYKAVSHFTGYTYDTLVPLIFVGDAFLKGKYSTEVFIHDIAPTLAFAAGFNPPALSEGRVLKESLK